MNPATFARTATIPTTSSTRRYALLPGRVAEWVRDDAETGQALTPGERFVSSSPTS